MRDAIACGADRNSDRLLTKDCFPSHRLHHDGEYIEIKKPPPYPYGGGFVFEGRIDGSAAGGVWDLWFSEFSQARLVVLRRRSIRRVESRPSLSSVGFERCAAAA